MPRYGCGSCRMPNHWSAMSRDHGLPFCLAYGTFSLGYARWRAGEREAGETGMRQGMGMCGEQGICARVPLFIARHAEAEAEIGHFESALAMVDDAIALSERTSQHSFDAELHRVRGDTLLPAYRPILMPPRRRSRARSRSPAASIQRASNCAPQ